MIHENILHLPEICNFQEAINVRLALAMLFICWAVYATLNANMAIV